MSGADYRQQEESEQQEWEETMEFYKRVAEIQCKLKAPKGQENKFGGYRYRSCEDIMEAVKPLLGGLVLTVCDDIVMVGDRIYVKATASITDGHTTISNTAFAREAQSRKGMDDSQITGSASSYARKYALNGLLLIDDTKDADTQDNRKVNDQAAALKDAIAKHQDTIDVIQQGIKDGDIGSAAEAWFELDQEEMKSLWVAPTKGGPFTTKEREIMKSPEFRKAHFGDSE